MNKVLIFSDIHIAAHKGSLDRLDDCLKVLEWVFHIAREMKIKVIIFAGDLFQNRQKIQVIAYQKTFELFEKNSDIDTYLLLGNHDLWYDERCDISSVLPLRALNKVHIVGDPCTINILGHDIDFIPYTKNPKQHIDKYFKNKSDVLFGHLAVNGAYLNTYYKTVSDVSVECDDDMVKVDVTIFDGWKKVFLGHYHGEQKLNKYVEYIGSPLQLNFSEVFQTKHIIALDLDTLDCDYINNAFSPKHLIIDENEIDKYDINNNFVQVVSSNLNSSKILDIKKSLEGKVGELKFKEIRLNKDANLKIDLDKSKKILSDGEVIEKYIEAMQPKTLDINKLMSIGRTITSKVSSV